MNRPGRQLFLPALCVLLLISAAGAGERSQPLLLEHAQRAESHWQDEKLITILEGGVHLVHGRLHLRSHRATWYEQDQLVIFEGRVILEDTTRTLTAHRLTYRQVERTALADGQVVLVDSLDHLQLTAGHVEYDRPASRVRAELDPRLTIRRPEGGEPILIAGHHMEVLLETREAIVHDRVTITRGSMVASCGRAHYFDEQDLILLEEEPAVREGRSLLQGDQMMILLEDDEVAEIRVQGDASGRYLSAADSSEGRHSGEHLMTAREIAFFLQDEAIERIAAQGNASSVYLPPEDEKGNTGVNRTSGDRVEIFLRDERVQRALVEGGAQGSYVTSQEDRPDTALYGADRIEYFLDRDEISLEGHGTIDYLPTDISLQAHRIVYNTRTEILTARGRPEAEADGGTVAGGEEPSDVGTAKDMEPAGYPVLREGSRELTGLAMMYNLRTRRGKVVEGGTEFEKGYYRGATIRKVDDTVLKATGATFTTCDHQKQPHYHFYSRQMKIILKDKVIAKPVIMYIGKIPVMILPFYVFPIKRGRHSGLLIPHYGSTETDGRYLKQIGYYLAPSQYWDATLAADIYERTGWLLDVEGRYAVRYLLHGELAGSYKWDERYYGSVLQKRRRWDLRLNHFQDITPSLQLQASGTFIGENDRSYYQDISDDPYERMDRSLHSFFSLDQSWSGARISLDLDQRWDLEEDVTTRYLPTISFQRFERPIYQPKAAGIGPGGAVPTAETPWYSSIYYRYSARFINYQKDWTEEQDSVTVDRSEEHQAVDQTLGLRVPLNLFGHLALTPSATYRETWFDRDKTGERYARRGDYDASVGANTTLYGLIQPHIGPLVGLRHVVKPSLSFSWRPDFADRDEYYSIPYIHSVGGPQKTLGISLANQFQAKLKSGDGERKITLADLNFNTGYNFQAETRKLSNLSSSLRMQPDRRLSVTLNANHDFYAPDGRTLRVFSPRLISFSVDTRLSLSGRGGLGSGETAGGSWRVNLSHRYAESRSTSGTRKTSWVSGGMSVPLTDHWRVDYTGRYDIVDKKMVSQRVEFYRDLHCWEARFVWEPTGYRQGYYVRINIKAIPEIKLERIKGIAG